MKVFDIDAIFSIYRCLKRSMFSFDVPSLICSAMASRLYADTELLQRYARLQTNDRSKKEEILNQKEAPKSDLTKKSRANAQPEGSKSENKTKAEPFPAPKNSDQRLLAKNVEGKLNCFT